MHCQLATLSTLVATAPKTPVALGPAWSIPGTHHTDIPWPVAQYEDLSSWLLVLAPGVRVVHVLCFCVWWLCLSGPCLSLPVLKVLRDYPPYLSPLSLKVPPFHGPSHTGCTSAHFAGVSRRHMSILSFAPEIPSEPRVSCDLRSEVLTSNVLQDGLANPSSKIISVVCRFSCHTSLTWCMWSPTRAWQ